MPDTAASCLQLPSLGRVAEVQGLAGAPRSIRWVTQVLREGTALWDTRAAAWSIRSWTDQVPLVKSRGGSSIRTVPIRLREGLGRLQQPP